MPNRTYAPPPPLAPPRVWTHCRRGHRLEEPNLVPSLLAIGKRTCLVCSRARAAVSNAKRSGGVVALDDALANELSRTDQGRAAVAAVALS